MDIGRCLRLRRGRRTTLVAAVGVCCVLVAAGIAAGSAGPGQRRQQVASPAPSQAGRTPSPAGSVPSPVNTSDGAFDQTVACTWVEDPAATGEENGFVGYPPSQAPASGTQVMTLTTNLGTLAVEIDVEKVPCTAASFTFLASKAYFDNTTCHRLVTKPLAILQCGDPSGTGSGGPGYRFDDENLPEVLRQGAPTDRTVLYPAGTLAMANYGADTNGSQFFIVYEDTVLPADHPVVGSLSEGIELVRRVAAGGVIACDSRGPDDGVPKTTLSITTLRMSQAG